MDATVGVFSMWYDEQADVMEVSFQRPVASLTIRFEDDVYVHIDPETQRPVGLTIHRFSHHRGRLTLPFVASLDPSNQETRERLRRALVPA